MAQAVSPGRSARRSQFGPRSMHVKVAVKVENEQGFLRVVLLFSPVSTFPPYSSSCYYCSSQNNLQSYALAERWEAMNRKSTLFDFPRVKTGLVISNSAFINKPTI